MAKAAKKDQSPPQIGHNIDGLHSEIREIDEKITDLEKARKAINEEIASLRSQLETKGLTRKGQAAVRSFFKLDNDERKAFDNTVVLYREAKGAPIRGAQLDLPIEPVNQPAETKEGE